MTFFILFLFVAYVSPVFFLKGIETGLVSHTVKQERPSEASGKALAHA